MARNKEVTMSSELILLIYYTHMLAFYEDDMLAFSNYLHILWLVEM